MQFNRVVDLVPLVSVASLLSCPHAHAQSDAANYPTRPIRIVVPQSPGGSTDLTARLVAKQLNEAFKQSAVVDNRPGAGSTSGTEIVARAAPDGYTMLVVASSFTINPALKKNCRTIRYAIFRRSRSCRAFPI